MYRVLGRNEEALFLLEKNLTILKKEKQYTFLRKGLIQAIEIAKLFHNCMQEIKYLIELLEIITIQKEITTDEAETYIEQLELYSQCENFTEKDKFALFFFKLKREFKLGIYTKQNNTIIETAKDYYEGCIHKNLTDNTDDWLGRICSCYALLILGVLWDKLMADEKSHLKICRDFELGEHNELYKKDISSFLSGDYKFMKSPYIQNGYIYFVG